jgi:hypothetical protein
MDRHWCTATKTERRLEVFAWCHLEGATYSYFQHESSLLDFTTADLTYYTVTEPDECEFELVQAVSSHLEEKERSGW